MNPFVIYKRLYRHFGSQGWWPILGSRRGEWISVYKTRKRLDSSQMFEISVGAILTQNASWQNAAKALVNLKKARVLNPTGLRLISAKRLASLIRPSGYFNQKAKKLKAFSSWLLINYRGDFKAFFKNPLSKCRRELLSLYGLGPETADSILLYAGGKRIFVIDAYTVRLLELIGIRFKKYEEYRHWFESRLPKSARLFNEFHALIVAWAKAQRQDPAKARRIIGLQAPGKKVK